MKVNVRVERIGNGPIITPETDPSIGLNINGPTLIKVPEWVKDPLGKYYLYFAHHRGQFIRLAYSDNIEGPWTIYTPGVLQLKDCKHMHQDPAGGIGHIASPEILLDEENKRMIMYYHGSRIGAETLRGQATYVATSEDGLVFDVSRTDEIGYIYMRAFRHGGYVYTLDMQGTIRRSKDGLTDFEKGVNINGTDDVYNRVFDPRHFCFYKKTEDLMYVMFSLRGTAPESLCFSTMDISKDWSEWCFDGYKTVLQPEMDWEGAVYPNEKSVWGDQVHVRQLRDPFMYEENGTIYVFYTVAGEDGIAMAKLIEE